MLVVLFCVAIAVVWLFPQTPVGRSLRRLLVEWPVRASERMTPVRWVFATLALVAVVAMIAYAKADGAMLIGPAIPEGIAWFALFDVATYLDAIGLLLLIAATVRLRAVLEAARALLIRARRRMGRSVSLPAVRRALGMRSRSSRGRRRPGTPPREDDDGWPAVVARAFRTPHLRLEPSA